MDFKSEKHKKVGLVMLGVAFVFVAAVVGHIVFESEYRDKADADD